MKKHLLPLLLLIAPMSVHASSLEELMVYPSEYVGSQPVINHANRWWQWTVTMPDEISPVRDLTGEHCNVNQEGEVWYLAGGYGSSTIKRSCTLPAGKHVFFPIINMAYWPRFPGSLTCERAKKLATLNNDKLLSIEVQLDDIIAWNPANTRISSEDCFDLLGLIPREAQPPKVFPAASDGYWVMLKPLAKGTHTLKFRAAYDSERGPFRDMVQDIEYELIIE